MKNNSYLIIWDYDTPYNYKNLWKYDKSLRSYKRNLLKNIYEVEKKLYLVSKQLQLKDGSKINTYNSKTNIDNIFAVMILKNYKLSLLFKLLIMETKLIWITGLSGSGKTSCK